MARHYFNVLTKWPRTLIDKILLWPSRRYRGLKSHPIAIRIACAQSQSVPFPCLKLITIIILREIVKCIGSSFKILTTERNWNYLSTRNYTPDFYPKLSYPVLDEYSIAYIYIVIKIQSEASPFVFLFIVPLLDYESLLCTKWPVQIFQLNPSQLNNHPALTIPHSSLLPIQQSCKQKNEFAGRGSCIVLGDIHFNLIIKTPRKSSPPFNCYGEY